MRLRGSLALWCVVLFSMAGPAQGAGGHFEVDDAYVLDPGRCQVEAWLTRSPALSLTALHLGSACRVGSLELGLSVDRSAAGNPTTVLASQVKWASGAWRDRGQIGVGAAIGLDTRNGRWLETVYVPMSWRIADAFWVHANLGVDRDRAGLHRRHGGSAEWAMGPGWILLAERVAIVGAHTTRIGIRFAATSFTNIDIGAARVGPDHAPAYVVGVNHEFGR